MRTTLTIDSDVAERIQQEVASGRRTLKDVINERLRAGFGIKPASPRRRFKVEPHRSAYQPGVDAAKLNQLVDELEMEAAGRRLGQR
jgi:hypothetical protein